MWKLKCAKPWFSRYIWPFSTAGLPAMFRLMSLSSLPSICAGLKDPR
jgi:hypothetical protein